MSFTGSSSPSSRRTLDTANLTEILGNSVSIDFEKERERRRQRRRDNGVDAVVVVTSDTTTGVKDQMDRSVAATGIKGGETSCNKDEATGSSRPSTTGVAADKAPSGWSLSIDGVCRTVKNAFHRTHAISLRKSVEDELASTDDVHHRRNTMNPILHSSLSQVGESIAGQSNGDISTSPVSSPEEKKRRRIFQPSVHRAKKRRKQTTLASMWFGGLLGSSSGN